MVYAKTEWKDHVVDATTGSIIQQGTPVSATNLNKIEKGIEDAHAQLEGAGRATQTLQHGVSILNGNNTAPVDIQIEGRTLVSLGNTPLDPLKNYVLADKRTKLKFTNNTYQGVSKFTGENGKPQITRIANFEGKVSGSTLENPHIMKRTQYGATGNENVLLSPSSFPLESDGNIYGYVTKLDGGLTALSNSKNGNIAQHLFSFDLIAEVERQIGRIPRQDVAGKVQWLKDNLSGLTFNWYGLGNGVGGNRSNIAIWRVDTQVWDSITTNTNSSVGKLFINSTQFTLRVDPNGFIHFIAYAEASDGVTPSIINTDYAELEIGLKQGAVLFDPCIPLYEVPADEYTKILVDWNDTEVINRYPKVQGVQHLQNPVIMAEGENMAPPFNEWTIHANAKAISPYELELNSTGSNQSSMASKFPIVAEQSYIAYMDEVANGGFYVEYFDANNAYISGVYDRTQPTILKPPVNAKMMTLGVRNTGGFIGKVTFKNLMLTVGTVKKPFVPRNPSYLYAQTKLGQIGTAKDRLYKDGQDWKLRKEIEKDVILDGSLNWLFTNDYPGFKQVGCGNVFGNANTIAATHILNKFDGKSLRHVSPSYIYDVADKFNIANDNKLYISLSDTETGWGETYTPIADEIKAYFNGWQAKTIDGTGKPTAWKSLVDGADAPTQTLAYVSANKVPNFTPYKLSYILASPVMENANDKVEGDISVNGLTQIEVGSGIIVREKVTPSLNGATNTRYYINDVVYGSKLSKSPVNKILAVYKNSIPDNKWVSLYDNNAYGKHRLYIEKADYDPTAEYTVTYQVYDREKYTVNVVNALASFANNIRGALEDTVKKVEDTATNVSINAMLLYDVLKRLKAGGL
ncbi:hypothetical protein [Bacillus sp. ISL-57]|uniref:hypothetical protein n=1 Tax=Bacillus sp. ISL-57 TaxID=2819135 RepID=UPI002035CD14|nr:hypothetical protein [Bacillus sp. ISL-57]